MRPKWVRYIHCGVRASSRATDSRSRGGSNCTGVELALIHGPRAVSNSR